jgi:hypothetical protein
MYFREQLALLRVEGSPRRREAPLSVCGWELKKPGLRNKKSCQSLGGGRRRRRGL